MIENDNQYISRSDVWVIADQWDDDPVSGIGPVVTADGDAIQSVKEYRISELGYYLLNPNPIMIKKQLIGFEYFYSRPAFHNILTKIRHLLPRQLNRRIQIRQAPSRVVTGKEPPALSSMKDPGLKIHMAALYDSLRPHEPVLKELAGLEIDQITDLNGICRDSDGGTSPLVLRGNLIEKQQYINDHLYKEVDILLNHGAYSADGLFKLGGFSFRRFCPATRYRLVKYYRQGRPAFLVASLQGNTEYEIQEPKMVTYLHLFEKCIQANKELRDAINTCINGRAVPLHLFFNTRPDAAYSEDRMPGLYQQLLSVSGAPMDMDLRTQLMESLNTRKIRVIFSYRPENTPLDANYLAAITVMHDLKALEPLKDNMPALYTAIRENTLSSDAGRFYLLETLHGRHTEQ